VCGIAGGIVAALVPLDVLGDLVSIGTLLAFLIVCTGVLVLRRTHLQIERPFRVPRVGLIAGLGLVSSFALMATLPIDTWIRLAIWLVIGLTIFFTYARAHTNATFSALAREGDV
jgi:APA family basic amino acid/polyamine antiporter